MAMIPMEYGGGWTEYTFTPQSGYSAVSNYGTMYGLLNKELGLAQVIWSGNSTPSVIGSYSFNLPNDFTPKRSNIVPIKDGNYMEVRTDGRIFLSLSNLSWSGGSITYALNK